MLQLVAAVLGAWTVWPTIVAVLVSLLVVATLMTGRHRRRWLLSRNRGA